MLNTEAHLAPHFCPVHFDPIHAVGFIRKMNGGSQSSLIQASDGNFYVLKFANNPQGPNVLFNEAFGSLLAGHLGLPIPSWRCIRVDTAFISENPELGFSTEAGLRLPSPGLHFGSRFIMTKPNDELYEIVPSRWMQRVRNPSLFARMLLLDIWTENVDRRQALFIERSDDRALDVVFFDHGHMFGGSHGNEGLRSPMGCAYSHLGIYRRAFEGRAIDAGLILIEQTDKGSLRAMINEVPSQWRQHALAERIITRLLRNRASLRATIAQVADVLTDGGGETVRLHGRYRERSTDRRSVKL